MKTTPCKKEIAPDYLHGESHGGETRMRCVTFKNSRPGLMTKKEGGPAGLRDLPCFPYLPFTSLQCPKIQPDGYLLWRMLNRTA